MVGTTRLEPATSAVTGQRSNQLSYVPTLRALHRSQNENTISPVQRSHKRLARFLSYHEGGLPENALARHERSRLDSPQ